MTLHIMSTSPFVSNVVENVLSRCVKDDGIILIQDAVYCLAHLSTLNALFDLHKNKDIACYTLEDDMTARGSFFAHRKIDIAPTDFIKRVSVEKFVTLTLEHHQVISW